MLHIIHTLHAILHIIHTLHDILHIIHTLLDMSRGIQVYNITCYIYTTYHIHAAWQSSSKNGIVVVKMGKGVA